MLILASGDPSEAMAPRCSLAIPRPRTRDHPSRFDRIIALPLREAREVFEREYLNAQMLRFSGNISRTASLHRHGALGPAP